jgi:hypothetical protein
MRIFALRRILAAVALAAASGFAGCGGSSGSSSASSIKPGSYGGPTSQGEGVGIVVANDGKSVSAIAVKLIYSCPNGATEKDGSPSGPTSPVSLNGGSFSASWAAHGAAYKMSGAYSNGSFTGSLSGASAKCQSGKVNWSATPSTGASTTYTSATSGGSPAKTALANAAHAYNTGAAAFNLAVRTDARAGNLPAFKSDMAPSGTRSSSSTPPCARSSSPLLRNRSPTRCTAPTGPRSPTSTRFARRRARLKRCGYTPEWSRTTRP